MRNKKNKRFTYLFPLMFLLITLGGHLFQFSPVHAASSYSTEQVAVSLVVDSSGSMAESDPEKLTLQAMQIFIDLLSANDQIGVVRLTGTAQEVVPLQEVHAQGKEKLKKSLEGKFPADGASDYLPALNMAHKQLEAAPADAKRIIIFLTDGYPEPQLSADKAEYDVDAYKQDIQKQVASIAEAGIPIYTVGFGESDEALLEQIATTTKGKTFLLSQPSEVASSFFGILTDTKKRMTTETAATQSGEQTVLTLPVPGYTSQMTALIISDGSKLEVELDGATNKEGVFLDVNPGYALLTITQPEEESSREVKLAVHSNGQLQVAAARDMLFQPTILSPEEGMEYSLSEPLEINVAFNVPLPEDMRAEVKVIKNGIPDLNSSRLEPKGDFHSFTYNEVDEQGDYQIIITVRNEEGEVASLSNQIKVKDIPAIRSQSDWNGKVFKKGEKVFISGSLEKQNLRITQNQDMQLEHFQLVLEDSQRQVFPTALSDDPDQKIGDLVKGDGLYSLEYTFPEVGRYTASLQAKGTYKGSPILLKKPLGTFEVTGRGVLSVTVPQDEGLVDGDGNARIALSVESQSKREETVRIMIPETVGTISESEWKVMPGERLDRELVIRLNQDGTEIPSELPLTFQASDALTVVKYSHESGIALRNGQINLIDRLQEFANKHQTLLIMVLGVIIFFIVLGYILYFVLVVRKEREPILLVYASSDSPDESQTLQMRTEKNALRIAFGEGQTADVFLPLTDSSQKSFAILIEQESQLRKITPRFWAGYLALLPNRNVMQTVASANPPGYLKAQGSLTSKVHLEMNDSFGAGGYTFTYAPSEQKDGKNLLEGKDAFWQS